MGRSLLEFLRGSLARGCVLLAFSEFLFFNEGPVQTTLAQPDAVMFSLHMAEIIGFYLLPGALLYVLEPIMTSWPRVILAGAFVGWSIEAAVVPVAYENVPFSYFWTSVTWHALIDVALGWVLLRRVLFSASRLRALAGFAGAGALTAVWSTWTWEVLALDLQDFLFILAVCLVLLGVGYGLSLAERERIRPGRLGSGVAIGVNLLCWALWTAQVVPLAAGLALLAAVNGVALRRAAPGGLRQGPHGRAGLRRLPVLMVLPLAGAGAFVLIDSAGAAPALGSLVVPVVAFGGLPIYAWALFQGGRGVRS